MTDLNKIRSLKTLEEMKQDLTEFVTNPIIKELYVTEHGLTEDDYDSDREQAQLLLEKVNRRMASLARFLNRPSMKTAK